MHPYLLQKLAAEHIKDMHAEAAAQRLTWQARRARRRAHAKRGPVVLTGTAVPTGGGGTRESAGRAALSDHRGLGHGRA